MQCGRAVKMTALVTLLSENEKKTFKMRNIKTQSTQTHNEVQSTLNLFKSVVCNILHKHPKDGKSFGMAGKLFQHYNYYLP